MGPSFSCLAWRRPLPPRRVPCSATGPSNWPDQGRATRSDYRTDRSNTRTVLYTLHGPTLTVLHHPLPHSLYPQQGPRPARAVHGRSIDVAPGKNSLMVRTDRSRIASGGLALEPSNEVHSFSPPTTQLHHHHHHDGTPLRRLPAQTAGLGARMSSN